MKQLMQGMSPTKFSDLSPPQLSFAAQHTSNPGLALGAPATMSNGQKSVTLKTQSVGFVPVNPVSAGGAPPPVTPVCTPHLPKNPSPDISQGRFGRFPAHSSCESLLDLPKMVREPSVTTLDEECYRFPFWPPQGIYVKKDSTGKFWDVYDHIMYYDEIPENRLGLQILAPPAPPTPLADEPHRQWRPPPQDFSKGGKGKGGKPGWLEHGKGNFPPDWQGKGYLQKGGWQEPRNSFGKGDHYPDRNQGFGLYPDRIPMVDTPCGPIPNETWKHIPRQARILIDMAADRDTYPESENQFPDHISDPAAPPEVMPSPPQYSCDDRPERRFALTSVPFQNIARPKHPKVSLDGDIEHNPGPNAEPWDGHYRFWPELLQHTIASLHLPTPTFDLFASKQNAQTPEYCDADRDAFQLKWNQHVYWINPPFNLLRKVMDKILHDRPTAILLCPESTDEWFYQAMNHAALNARFHHKQRCFLLPTLGLLPPPPWPIAIFFFSPKCDRHPDTLRIPLYACGDIESNPGPTPISFPDFLRLIFQSFVTSANATDLARAKANLILRSSAWSNQWYAPLFPDPTNPPDHEAAMQAIAAFELFAQATLSMDNGNPTWNHQQNELEQLRAEIARLRVSPSVPTEASLTSTLSAENIHTFRSLALREPWMTEMAECFAHHAENLDDADSTLLRLWKILVKFHFVLPPMRNAPETSSSSQTRGFTVRSAYARPYGLSFQEAIAAGGRLEERMTPNGMSTFIIHAGKEFYKCRDGTLWPTADKPPKECFRCPGIKHWHWECPKNQ
jgi:hypothetical protein